MTAYMPYFPMHTCDVCHGDAEGALVAVAEAQALEAETSARLCVEGYYQGNTSIRIRVVGICQAPWCLVPSLSVLGSGTQSQSDQADPMYPYLQCFGTDVSGQRNGAVLCPVRGHGKWHEDSMTVGWHGRRMAWQ